MAETGWGDWSELDARHKGRRCRLWTAPGEDPATWQAQLLDLTTRERSDHGGRQLQGGRNVVSQHVVSGRPVVIKDFGLRHIQPLLYGLRSSKARRAAQAADLLHAEGLPTPRALAVFECQRGPLLERAFLVCDAIPDTRTLRAALEEDRPGTEPLLPAVGALIARLHDADFSHPDLTAANVLIDADDALWLIDINRLRRRHLDRATRLRHIAKLSLPDDCWPAFLDGYGGDLDADRERSIAQLVKLHHAFRARGQRKRARKAK